MLKLYLSREYKHILVYRYSHIQAYVYVQLNYSKKLPTLELK